MTPSLPRGGGNMQGCIPPVSRFLPNNSPVYQVREKLKKNLPDPPCLARGPEAGDPRNEIILRYKPIVVFLKHSKLTYFAFHARFIYKTRSHEDFFRDKNIFFLFSLFLGIIRHHEDAGSCGVCKPGSTIPPSPQSVACFMAERISAANSLAAAGPFAVMIRPSTTTG